MRKILTPAYPRLHGEHRPSADGRAGTKKKARQRRPNGLIYRA
jgi:hypothetical protein